VWPCIIYHVSPKELGFCGKGSGGIDAGGIGGGGGLVEFSNSNIIF
jgi:hypothetical protein